MQKSNLAVAFLCTNQIKLICIYFTFVKSKFVGLNSTYYTFSILKVMFEPSLKISNL